MTKTAALSIRIGEDLKQAIEKAAAEDDRSVASYVERVLRAHLQAKDYLPK